MKKLLLVLLVTLLAFAITACQGEDEPAHLAVSEAEDQEDANGEDTNDGNGTDTQDGEGVDREDGDREEEDGDEVDRDEAVREDRRASSDGPHGLDPNDPNLAANIEFMVEEEGSTWSDEAYDFVEELEEELWYLIELLEEELDRLLEPLWDREDQCERIDDLSDQLDYFIEDIYEEWDDLHERYDSNLISTQNFKDGLERLVESVRNFRFR